MKTSSMKSVEERVRELIVELLDVEADEVKPEANVVDDLGADSLDVVELVMSVEETFDLEIPDDDADKLKTVQNLIDYVQARVR